MGYPQHPCIPTAGFSVKQHSLNLDTYVFLQLEKNWKNYLKIENTILKQLGPRKNALGSSDKNKNITSTMKSGNVTQTTEPFRLFL